MLKTIHFYESNTLDGVTGACTTHKDFKDAVRNVDVLHTNETSALSFTYLDYYDRIVIHTDSCNECVFYKPIGKMNIEHNTTCGKELRKEHDLRRMFLAGMFK